MIGAAKIVVVIALMALPGFICFNKLLTPRIFLSNTRPPKLTRPSSSTASRLAMIADATLEPVSFLKVLMSSRSSTADKQDLVGKLQGLRASQSANTTRVEERNQTAIWNGDYADFLNAILTEVDRVKSNKFAMFQYYPFPLPSYRVKLGSLARLIMSILENEQTSTGDIAARHRRALSIILGQLQDSKGVWALERDAKRSSNVATMEEMLKRTPAGLETPEYTVVTKRPTWEVRNYKEFSVCSVDMASASSQGPGAFNALAGYIFGKNREQEKMAMTTPVISANPFSSEAGVARKMSFIMPSRFWGLQEEAQGQDGDGATSEASAAVARPPTPLDGSGVLLEGAGGGMLAVGAGATIATAESGIAVKWFGGYATKAQVDLQYKSLLETVAQDDEWALVQSPDSAGVERGEGLFLMQYNDPFQPPWKRRNEVAVPVMRKSTPAV